MIFHIVFILFLQPENSHHQPAFCKVWHVFCQSNKLWYRIIFLVLYYISMHYVLYSEVWLAVVTPTDRPKSVRNYCLIELFVALFVLSLCPFDISVGEGAFVIGLGQISSFLSLFLIPFRGNFIKTRLFVKINIYCTLSPFSPINNKYRPAYVTDPYWNANNYIYICSILSKVHMYMNDRTKYI